MIKYIYKTVGLLLIFVGALFFFGSRMSTNLNDTSKESKLQGETFPYITLTTRDRRSIHCMDTVRPRTPM